MDMTAQYAFNGYQYILSVIDIFSKYAYAAPLRAKDASTVADAMRLMLDQVDGGFSGLIQTDNGSEFMAEFAQLLRDRRITHRFTKSHTPQSNGNVERLNGIIRRKIYTIFAAGNRNWPATLPTIVNAINHAKHTTTKVAPVDAVVAEPAEKRAIHGHIVAQATPLKMNRSAFPALPLGQRVRIDMAVIDATIRANIKSGNTSKVLSRWSKFIYTVRLRNGDFYRVARDNVDEEIFLTRFRRDQLLPIIGLDVAAAPAPAPVVPAAPAVVPAAPAVAPAPVPVPAAAPARRPVRERRVPLEMRRGEYWR